MRFVFDARLPDRLQVTFPDGNEVKNGDSLCAGSTIGLSSQYIVVAHVRFVIIVQLMFNLFAFECFSVCLSEA